MGAGAEEAVDDWVGSSGGSNKIYLSYWYCAKHNQHASMLKLGGSGGMPPRKIFKKGPSEIESGATLAV